MALSLLRTLGHVDVYGVGIGSRTAAPIVGAAALLSSFVLLVRPTHGNDEIRREELEQLVTEIKRRSLMRLLIR